MNYIHSLQQENEALKAQLAAVNAAALEALVYYSSAKFQGMDNDYAHVSTDIAPKINHLKQMSAL